MIALAMFQHKIEYSKDPKFLILAPDTYVSICYLLTESKGEIYGQISRTNINWINQFEGVDIIIDPHTRIRILCVPHDPLEFQAFRALDNSIF